MTHAPPRDGPKSVLIIGSGPIVIGQACEFDYSGTQACRVLRAEGFRVILVNSNPATIMTDPEFADATYVEPITAESREDHRQGASRRAASDSGRADRAERRRRLHESGLLDKYDVELIGATRRDPAARTASCSRRCHRAWAAEAPRSHLPHHGRGARPPRGSATRWWCGPRLRMGGLGSGIAYDRGGAAPDRGGRAWTPRRPPRCCWRSDPRLEGVRARGDARQARQRGRRLLDREHRPDGRPHRRQGHGRPRP